MANIEIYKKPELALLKEEKKLKDYEQEKRLAIAESIVTDLLNTIGVSNKGNEDHHIALIKYLIEKEYEFTPREIAKAYSLALKGKLGVDLFQQLNVLQYSKVMNKYREYRNRLLKNYNSKQQKLLNTPADMSEAEKRELLFNGFKEQFILCDQKEEIAEGRIWISDKFLEFGIISETEKKACWRVACREVNEAEKKKLKSRRKSNEDLKIEKITLAKKHIIERGYSKYKILDKFLNEINNHL